MCDKALHIATVLKDIKKLIPDENRKQHNIIEKLIENVFFKAPELCNSYWLVVHDHLTRTFNNGLVWEESVCMTYNEGYKNYIEKYPKEKF